MTRTVEGRPSQASDWWGRRPFSTWISHGQRDTKWWKRKTHKIERQKAKEATRG